MRLRAELNARVIVMGEESMTDGRLLNLAERAVEIYEDLEHSSSANEASSGTQIAVQREGVRQRFGGMRRT